MITNQKGQGKKAKWQLTQQEKDKEDNQQADDEDESDHKRRPERVDRQGQRPTPQLASNPSGELRTFQRCKHCSILPRSLLICA